MRLGIIAFSLLVMMFIDFWNEDAGDQLRELQVEQAKLEIELLNLELSMFRDQESVSEEK